MNDTNKMYFNDSVSSGNKECRELGEGDRGGHGKKTGRRAMENEENL